MLDMMLQMQRIGMQAMTMYQPVASAFLDAATTPARSAGSAGYKASRDRGERTFEARDSNAEQVLAIGEEVLSVGTRMVPGKTTRVRRVVVETPVQQDVTLHTETVVVERRRPISGAGQDVLTEVTVEMSDFNEVPVVSKSVHLVEEVLLRKEVTERVETIRDTVKRDKLEIEDQTQLPVVFNPAQKQDESRRDERRAADTQDKKQAVVPMHAEGKAQAEAKPADQKRQAN
jgi:stress response protein YsnF